MIYLVPFLLQCEGYLKLWLVDRISYILWSKWRLFLVMMHHLIVGQFIYQLSLDDGQCVTKEPVASFVGHPGHSWITPSK